MQVEQYDLVIKIESIESDPIYKEIIEVVKSNEFKNELNGLGGYGLKDIGKIMGRTLKKSDLKQLNKTVIIKLILFKQRCSIFTAPFCLKKKVKEDK